MNRVRFPVAAIGFGLLFSSLPALAQLPGAVTTTTESGTAQTIFVDKSDVFFTAGPTATPCAPTRFVNDGQYYFQVTDLSGTELLSTDPASERLVTVTHGGLTVYNGHTHETDSAAISEDAPAGEDTEAAPVYGPCGALTVGLAPFRDAGSREASYLLWLTPRDRFSGEPTQIDPVCGDGCFHGFRPEFSLTSAFRVEDKRFCEDSFCVSGVKFEDRNGNGIHDSGEPGLTGVEIRADAESGVRLSGLTGSDGSFQVCGLQHGGDVRVTEGVPFGYRQTGPLDRRFKRRLIAQDLGYFVIFCDENFSGLDFGNQLIPNAIGGIKFEDLNANGVRDPGEPGLSGFTISLTPNSPGQPPLQTVVTDANGNFLFTSVPAGSFLLSETQRPGFSLTVPALNSIPVTLTAGGSSITNQFGNFRGVLTGTITGTKFLDANANGVRDAGEAGLAGVTITRTSSINDPSGVQLSVVTDASGNFTFPNVPFGSFTLNETVPAGFAQTAPPVPGTISAAINFANRTSANNLFGNRAVTGTISGVKFNDVNGNGIRDSGEPGLAGVTIRNTNASGTVTTTTSDASGAFSFTGLSAGAYTLSEVVPNGFTQTAPAAPGTITVNLAAGQTAPNFLFGNQATIAGSDTGSISGRKILDLDGNGIFDGNDRGFEGIVFELRDAAGTVRTTTSDAQGNFTFSNLPAGTYVLSEILPPNFFQTFPGTTGAPGTYTITLTTGQTATGFVFLNKC